MFAVCPPKSDCSIRTASTATRPDVDDLPLAPELKSACSPDLQWALRHLLTFASTDDIRTAVSSAHSQRSSGVMPDGYTYCTHMHEKEGTNHRYRFKQGAVTHFVSAVVGRSEISRLEIKDDDDLGKKEFKWTAGDEHLWMTRGEQGQRVNYTDPQGRRRTDLEPLFPPLVTLAAREKLNRLAADSVCVPWDTFSPAKQTGTDPNTNTMSAASAVGTLEDSTVGSNTPPHSSSSQSQDSPKRRTLDSW